MDSNRATVALLLVICGLLGGLLWERADGCARRGATDAGVAAWVDRAGQLADRGDLRAALIALEVARSLRGDDPAVVEAQMRMRVRAAAELPEVVADVDGPLLKVALDLVGAETAPAKTVAGRLAERDGRWAEARAGYTAALETQPGYLPASRALAALERRAGRLVEAQTALEAASELAPDDVPTRVALAEVYAALERTDDAITAYGAAVSKADAAGGPTASIRLALARLLAGAGRLPEAVQHLERAAQLRPRSAEVHHQLGAALERSGRLDAAEAALRRAVALDPKPALAYDLALVLQANQKLPEAAEVLRRLLAAEPRHVDAAYQLGATLQALGDGPGARQALERYLAVSASHPEEAARRAEVLRALQAPQPAPAPTEP